MRVETDDVLLRRIIDAAAIDTVIDTRLVVDPLSAPLEHAHEVNVDRHPQRCSPPAAARARRSASSCSSPPRSTTAAARTIPAFFAEEIVARAARRRPRSSATSSQAEAALAELAAARPRVTVTVLRMADAIGRRVRGSQLALLGLPVVPAILGFDPRCQFVHEDDVIGVLEHAARAASSRASTTWPPTACWRCRRSPRCSASRCCRCCRRGAPCSPPRSCDGSGCGFPSRCSASCATGAGSTTAG